MASDLESGLLRLADREEALRFLSRDAVPNLFLTDLTARLGAPSEPGESDTEIVGVWRGNQIVGLASLRPSVVFDANAGPDVVEAILPFLTRLSMGLVKSSMASVEALWKGLQRRRPRRALLDRIENTYILYPSDAKFVTERKGARFRKAVYEDLDELVIAARESLREEGRPDPFSHDVANFQHWVRGRVGRARVVEAEGRITMVGYADVQRPEGWLLQGIYTWTDLRQRGYGAFGVSEMCREAFEAGADHVQLAVIDGNLAAYRLYQQLGFKPYGKLRTILFS
jgi:RimJ/RimL family protein N-acetyltransferase